MCLKTALPRNEGLLTYDSKLSALRLESDIFRDCPPLKLQQQLTEWVYEEYGGWFNVSRDVTE